MVKFAVECVAVIFEYSQEWESCKKNVLSDTGLIFKLKNINVDQINQNALNKVKKKGNFLTES